MIDLPIARDRATGLPVGPGSGIKGALRASRPDDVAAEDWLAAFGPPPPAPGEAIDKETRAANDHAGAVLFTDAHLLVLAVRSVRGVMAWVTSPMVWSRWRRQASDVAIPGVPELGSEQAHVSDGSALLAPNARLLQLEELSLTATGEDVAALAQAVARVLFSDDERDAARFVAHFAVVPDDVLAFLARTATQVRARVRLDGDRKTVARGGLWYEEALPAESVLAGLMVGHPSRRPNHTASAAELLDAVLSQERMVQLGGLASTGMGLSRLLPVKP